VRGRWNYGFTDGVRPRVGRVTLVVVTGLLSACGSSETPVSSPIPSAVDSVPDTPPSTIRYVASPDLECEGESSGSHGPDYDLSRPGEMTVEAAAANALSYYMGRDGGVIIELRPGVFAMKLDGRIVVVAETMAGPAGGFWASAVHWCKSFAPVSPPTPATAPLVTAEQPPSASPPSSQMGKNSAPTSGPPATCPAPDMSICV
jgi:hypothetical protein